jgi:ParB/RepB/Spo0J family partition protein
MESKNPRLETISIQLIKPGVYSQRKSRVKPEKQAAFEKSIAEFGVLTEPWVCDIEGSQEKELIAGNRRLTAAEKAGFKEIKCKVYPSSTTETQKRIMSLTENLEREDLSAVDQAYLIYELYTLLGRDANAVAHQLNRPVHVIKEWIESRVFLERADEATEEDIPVISLLVKKLPPSRHDEAWAAIRHLDRAKAKQAIREMTRHTSVETDEIVDRVKAGKPTGTSMVVVVEDGDLHDSIKKSAIDIHRSKAEYLLELARIDGRARGYYHK